MEELEKKVREQIEEILQLSNSTGKHTKFVNGVIDKTLDKLTQAIPELVSKVLLEVLTEELTALGRAVPCIYAQLMPEGGDDSCELSEHKFPFDCLTCQDYNPEE